MVIKADAASSYCLSRRWYAWRRALRVRAATALGIVLFGRINESAFKRIIPGLLLFLFSGLCLVI
jgi:hypothetical protein